MTQSLPDVAVQQFRDQFQILYQAPRAIRGTTMEKHGVVGDAYKWPQMGPATMVERGASSSEPPAQDVTHPRVTTEFRDWVLDTFTDKFDQSTVNADERSALARQHKKAIERREDQTIIDALIVSGATALPEASTDLTVDKLRAASALLNKNNVDPDDRTILIHANNLKSLLEDSEVTSSDFNTVKALVDGKLDEYMGFKFITIGDRPEEGGLPITGALIRSCFVYQRNSMGLVYKIDPIVDINWEPRKRSWAIGSDLSIGADALQAPGIVEILCNETP